MNLSYIGITEELIQRLQELESNLNARKLVFHEMNPRFYRVIPDDIQKTDGHIANILLLVEQTCSKWLQPTVMRRTM